MSSTYTVRIESPTDVYLDRRMEVTSDLSAPDLARWLADCHRHADPSLPVNVGVWAPGDPANHPSGEAVTDAQDRPSAMTVHPDGYVLSSALVDRLVEWLRQAAGDLAYEPDGTPGGEHGRIAACLARDLGRGWAAATRSPVQESS